MKKLIIKYCDQCPHFKSKSRGNESDRFECICANPDLSETKEWDNRIGRPVSIPNFCPLDEEWECPTD